MMRGLSVVLCCGPMSALALDASGDPGARLVFDRVWRTMKSPRRGTVSSKWLAVAVDLQVPAGGASSLLTGLPAMLQPNWPSDPGYGDDHQVL